MKWVFVNENMEFEIKWMWLPLFIGQNAVLLKNLEVALKKEYPKGLSNEETSLSKIHEFVISWLSKQIPIPGLAEYLKAVDHIDDAG